MFFFSVIGDIQMRYDDDDDDSALFAVVRCPSVRMSRIVSKRLNLPSNFFHRMVAGHHSSFPTGDPSVKFRRSHPQ